MRSALVVGIVLVSLTGSLGAADHPLLGKSNAVVLGPSARLGDGLRDAILRMATEAFSLGPDAAGRVGPAPIRVDYPAQETIFPPDLAAPTFIWSDPAAADTWLIDIASGATESRLKVLTRGAAPPRPRDSDPRTLSEAAQAYQPPDPPVPVRRWMPGSDAWEQIKGLSRGQSVTIRIVGFSSREPGRALSCARVRCSVSNDPVGAPIFYRDVSLPFRHALNHIDSIRWRLGAVSSYRPATLLTGLKVCGNCHSFTADGKTMAMDVDYGSDKGSYIIADIEPRTVWRRDQVISWSDYRREDNEPTFGLLSQLSPDGRYVISTVKDRSVFAPVDDLYYSQRFFPVTGILVVYDRRQKQYFPLAGADDRRYVQSNPVWSPDGRTILFARSASYTLGNLKDPSSAVVERDEVREFFEGGKKFRYDLYRLDFNEGRGGTPSPLPGASDNGRSNYFPRFSPDGRWLVFCQSDSFMLLRPDSTLCIMPAAGGTPRPMRCNFPDRMNSWHSWSPNGRWLVFASKAQGPFTQLWLTHIDEDGNDSPAVFLEHFTAADRAANIPEFVNVRPERFVAIRQEFADYYTHYRIGIGHEQRHEYAQAIEEFRIALAEKSDHAESLYLLASCLARLHREREALAYAREAIRLVPGSVPVHGLLGSILCSTGHYGEALIHLEAAYAANRSDVSLANNLAWLLATCPEGMFRDGPRALQLAEWACQATAYKSPPLLDSLAAAYAEVGRFDEAVRTIQKAIAIVRGNPKASTAILESRLGLYQAAKPCRDVSAP